MAQVHAVPYHVQRTLEELSSRFAKATKGVRDNTRGSQLNKWQVDFCYMMDDIVRGPGYIAPKIVDNTNRFIDGIIKTRRELAEAQHA